MAIFTKGVYMDNTKLIEDEKLIIMNDLWKQVDRNNCLLDVLLSNKKNSDVRRLWTRNYFAKERIF